MPFELSAVDEFFREKVPPSLFSVWNRLGDIKPTNNIRLGLARLRALRSLADECSPEYDEVLADGEWAEEDFKEAKRARTAARKKGKVIEEMIMRTSDECWYMWELYYSGRRNT